MLLLPALLLASFPLSHVRPLDSGSAPAGSRDSSGMYTTVEAAKQVTVPSRTHVVPQFLAGAGGAALGGLAGAAIGGFVGIFYWMADGQDYKRECNTVCTPDADDEIETGARIGALVGGGYVATIFLLKTSSATRYPPKVRLTTFAGVLAGGGLGWLATGSMVEPEGGNTWPRWGILAASASLGGVLANRLWAEPSTVGLAPWSPGPGAWGAMARIAL